MLFPKTLSVVTSIRCGPGIKERHQKIKKVKEEVGVGVAGADHCRPSRDRQQSRCLTEATELTDTSGPRFPVPQMDDRLGIAPLGQVLPFNKSFSTLLLLFCFLWKLSGELVIGTNKGYAIGEAHVVCYVTCVIVAVHAHTHLCAQPWIVSGRVPLRTRASPISFVCLRVTASDWLTKGHMRPVLASGIPVTCWGATGRHLLCPQRATDKDVFVVL